MTDPELFTLLIAGFQAGLAARAPGVDIKQNYQPTQQGAQTPPTLYLHKLFDTRRGWVARKDVYDPDADEGRGAFLHKESQWYETTFQILALATGSPVAPNAPTASDIANVAADIMQSDSMMGRLRAANVGVLRISGITNPYSVNDTDRFEGEPSFDFVLTHKREYIDGVPAVSLIEINIARV